MHSSRVEKTIAHSHVMQTYVGNRSGQKFGRSMLRAEKPFQLSEACCWSGSLLQRQRLFMVTMMKIISMKRDLLAISAVLRQVHLKLNCNERIARIQEEILEKAYIFCMMYALTYLFS